MGRVLSRKCGAIFRYWLCSTGSDHKISCHCLLECLGNPFYDAVKSFDKVFVDIIANSGGIVPRFLRVHRELEH